MPPQPAQHKFHDAPSPLPRAVPNVDPTNFIGGHALGSVDQTLAQPAPDAFRPPGLSPLPAQLYGGAESDPAGNVRRPGNQL